MKNTWKKSQVWKNVPSGTGSKNIDSFPKITDATVNDEVVKILPENNSGNAYNMQSRSLESYYQWMNASMATKVWPTMVHLLGSPWAKIIDMGTWSGDAAWTYANIFGESHIIGVDINPDSIDHCRETFQTQDNLEFVEGDIEKMIFPEGSIDAILNSSTLHHVSSFNNYSAEHIKTSIRNQIRQLKDNGMLIIRDFLGPDNNPEIIIELSNEKQECPDEVWCNHEYCGYSDAELFEIFSKTSRSLSKNPGFPISQIKSDKTGWNKYQVKHQQAIEFVLRKDYKKQWEVENREEYTYFNQGEFEKIFEENGMRIIASYPYYNPWIIENRFKDKFHFYNLEWDTMDYPATNYVIVGQKIPENSTYWNKIQQTTKKSLLPEEDFFLKRRSYTHKTTQEVWDVVERPWKVNDIIPYTVDQNTWDVHVSVKWWYPRPLIWLNETNIDKKKFSGYICEPHSMSTESDETNISTRVWIKKDDMQKETSGLTYFPSPWMLSEKVTSRFIECEVLPTNKNLPEYLSGFKNSWEARSMEINHVLKAIQTGTMPEARLEMNLYFLLKQLKKSPQEWIWDTISIEEISMWNQNILTTDDMKKRGTYSSFEETSDLWSYITHYTSEFEELLSKNNTNTSLWKNTLEYVVPTNQSWNVISVLPVIKNKQDGKIYVWLEKQEYPSIQEKEGYSDIWWVPAYRLPKDITNYTQLEQFYRENISTTSLHKIGESYKPSIWVSPETIYPYTSWEHTKDKWISYIALEDLYNSIHHIKDMHLIISIFRLYHLYQSDKIKIQK